MNYNDFETSDAHNTYANRFDLDILASDMMAARYKLNRVQQHYFDLWISDVQHLTKAQQRKAFRLAWRTR